MKIGLVVAKSLSSKNHSTDIGSTFWVPSSNLSISPSTVTKPSRPFPPRSGLLGSDWLMIQYYWNSFRDSRQNGLDMQEGDTIILIQPLRTHSSLSQKFFSYTVDDNELKTERMTERGERWQSGHAAVNRIQPLLSKGEGRVWIPALGRRKRADVRLF